jgi:hypothetical protein
MISPVELRRIIAEWRLRVQRVKDILQPPTWTEREWRQFSQTLALLVREHGKSWIVEPNVYWDLRWRMVDGGELVCQIEHIPGEKTSLVVAQNGGFTDDRGTYTWLFAEFNMEGQFARDPYWVDGMWKEALAALLIPLDRQSSYMLVGRSETPDSLLLQEGARPNDGQIALALMLGQQNGATEQYAAEEPQPAPPSAEEPAPAQAEEPTPAPAEEPAPPAAEEQPAPSPESVVSVASSEEPAPAAYQNGNGTSENHAPPAPGPTAFTIHPSRKPGRLRRERASVRHFRAQRRTQPRSYYRKPKLRA